MKNIAKIKDTVNLGYNFAQDQFCVFYMAPEEHLSKTEYADMNHFGVKLKQMIHSLFESDDHPEPDVSEFLDEVDTKIYQPLIGFMQ